MGRQTRVRQLYAGVAAAFLVALSIPARAGNLDAFYLSGEAAMQAGAISADSRGGGAVWYNPAGLADLDGLRLDVSVNGYAVRFGGSADFDAPAGSTVERLTSLDINVVPTALTITKNFGRVGFGFGVFVPSQGTNILRTQITLPADATGTTMQFSYDAYRRFQEYHVGPALGLRVSDDLKLGASFLVNYKSLVEMGDTAFVARNGGISENLAAHSLLDSIQLGAEFVLGAQWAFAKDWNLGLVARTPAMRLYQLVQTLDTSVASNGEAEMDAKEVSGLDSSVLTPFRFHAGLSHVMGDWRAAVEASLLLPFEDANAGTATRLTYNARVGARRTVTPTLAFGGGLFTDLSPAPDPKEFGDARINYYGTTLSVDWGTPYGIYAKDGQPYPRPRTLVFGTTVALSYAFGLGQVVRAAFGAGADGLTGLAEVPTDVTAHEIYLHLGSTLAE